MNPLTLTIAVLGAIASDIFCGWYAPSPLLAAFGGFLVWIAFWFALVTK